MPVSRFLPVSVVGANSHKIYVLINMSRSMDSYVCDETRQVLCFFFLKLRGAFVFQIGPCTNYIFITADFDLP
jgi:hypothetical protein